jgi:hypothetical protein
MTTLSGSNRHRQVQTLLQTLQTVAHQWRPVSLTNTDNILIIMCFRTFVGSLSVCLCKVRIDLKLSNGYVPYKTRLRQEVGRAIAQAVSHRLPTAAARVRAQVRSLGFVVEKVAPG